MFKKNSSFNVLYTTDLVKTHDFYQKLGLEIKQYEKDKVVVSLDTFDFHFILNTTEPFGAYKYIAEPQNYGKGVIFYVEVDNIHEMPKLIRQAGGQVRSGVFKNLWGCEELLFEDPNGYKLAVYQPI